eukprot:6295886-Ditylum_brightwellii.AAC.1
MPSALPSAVAPNPSAYQTAQPTLDPAAITAAPDLILAYLIQQQLAMQQQLTTFVAAIQTN